MSISSAFQNGASNPHKRRRETDFDTLTFEQLLVRLIARCSLPFTIVRRPEFRDLIHFLNANSEESLPRSDSIVREWVV